MHLAFYIFQGIGMAAAVGIRPFLLAMALAAIALALVERSRRLDDRAGIAVLAVAGAALGALLFAGSLSRGHYLAWPGIVGGIVCALVALAAVVPLLRRVRGRLDQSAAASLPVFVEGAALLVGVLSVVAPPVGPIALLLLLWLLFAGRVRGEKKYAGLRILR